MSDTGGDGSPIEASAVGPAATAAFGLLSDETRLAILLALWEATDPHAGVTAVPFSELRERVGVRDSGQFNYHLGRLGEGFVRRTDEGYSLTPVGMSLVQTVVAGAPREVAFPRTELDLPCHRCGAPTALVYDDGWLYHVCTGCEGGLLSSEFPEGTLFAEPFLAGGLSNRTPEEVFAAGVFRLLQATATKAAGLCPRCGGIVESSLHACEDHDPVPDGPCPACGTTSADAIRIQWRCTVCKYHGGASPGGAVMGFPAVVAFYHDHGIDLGPAINDFEHARRVLALLRAHETELVESDPVRVRVEISYGGDSLGLTLDGELTVLGVDRGEPAGH